MMAAAPDGRGSQRSMAGLGRFGAAVAIGRWPSGQVRSGATWASRPSAATHRTLIVFTACWGCRPSPVSYSLATVDHRSAGTARRRQLTTAIVAALSLFVALIAGSSLRPQFAAAALTEPAGWASAYDSGTVRHPSDGAARLPPSSHPKTCRRDRLGSTSRRPRPLGGA